MEYSSGDPCYHNFLLHSYYDVMLVCVFVRVGQCWWVRLVGGGWVWCTEIRIVLLRLCDGQVKM